MKLKLLTRQDVQGLADSRRVFDSGEEYLQAGAVYEFSYLTDIRQVNSRRSALQDEFRDL